VIPTIHDVRGMPIPGLGGTGLRPLPAHGGFDQVLQQVHAVPTPAPVRGSAAAALATTIRSAARTAGVDPALSVAVARAESNLNPRARSSDGKSVGTFQMTAATATEMRQKIARGTVARPSGPDDVALGVGYLHYLDGAFSRRAQLARGLATVPVADATERKQFAVAAFNAGEGRVARAQAQAAAHGGDPTKFADVKRYLPAITQVYVPRVVAYAANEAGAARTG
jgi:membrane-bound lytic murein transglycosylase MltF